MRLLEFLHELVLQAGAAAFIALLHISQAQSEATEKKWEKIPFYDLQD